MEQAFDLSDNNSLTTRTEVQKASNQSPITCEELADIEVASTQTPISVHEKEIASGDTENNKLTSDVWEHFKRQKVGGNLEYIAVCNYCHKRLSAKRKNGTSHLGTHMGLCFMRSNHTVESTQKQLQAKKESGKCKISTFSFNQETSRKELANMIIIHEYPLNMVEHWAFKKFVGSLQPMFRFVSRNTVKSDILKIYNYERAKTMSLLDSNRSRIAITTDMWTASNQQKGFMAITSHFIDDNWELQSRIIRFLYVPCPHTAEVLSEALVSCLLEWNIDSKLSTLTVDNCTTNDAMIDILLEKISSSSLSLNGDLFHMRCAAHILNLIVKEGMSVISDSIERIRNSVLFWSATPKRQETFYGTARKCNISCNRNLVQDCKTRWNSTYLMLDRALVFKEVFPRLKQRESLYKFLPTEEDWVFAKEIRDRLESFYEVTTLFSGTRYPTANIYFSSICEIKLSIYEWMYSNCEKIRAMADSMIGKFEKYWSVVHGFMAMAAVLDPRFKMKLIEYYFDLLYGDGAQKEIENVRSFCYDMLKDYQARCKSKENSQVPVQASAASSSRAVVAHSKLGKRLANFDAFVDQSGGTTHVKSELDYYLEESVIPRSENFDILCWWKTNGSKYPTLQAIARDVLAIPVSTVASESAFSTGGRFVSPHRSRLHPKTLEALMCAQNWLCAEFDDADFSNKVGNSKFSEDEDIVDEASCWMGACCGE